MSSLGSIGGFNSSQVLTLAEEYEEVRPQLLYTKFQRLKNTATKLARVLIIDEMPTKLNTSNQNLKEIGQRTTRDTVGDKNNSVDE